MLKATNLDLPWNWRLNLAERTSGNGYGRLDLNIVPCVQSPHYTLLEGDQIKGRLNKSCI